MTAPVLDAPKEPLPARPPLAKNAIPATYASGGFLTYEDVREIVNRQSFFVQQHGVLMNVAFAVRPSHVRRMEGSAAGDAVKTFLADLQREFGKAPFASIAIIERDEGGIIGLVVAHISCLTESDGVVRLNEFCNTWTDGTGPCVIDMRRSRGRRDWSFHLEETLRLCAGYQQDSFSK